MPQLWDAQLKGCWPQLHKQLKGWLQTAVVPLFSWKLLSPQQAEELIFQCSLSLQELDEFWVYKALLAELTKQLTYCVQAELIPLMEVTGVQEVSNPA